MKRSHRAYDVVKRVLDIAAALLALVVLSPVLLVVAILVRAQLGSPVLFRQMRPGKDGKLFNNLKFRTMRDAPAGVQGVESVQATDEARQTTLGRRLRSTSLDELPEFFNVLVGDMSMVGPRPLLTDYLGRYNEEQARRHEVRPGITGWAQVNGRNATTWEERFAMDVWYVDHRSLALDAKISWMTLAAVFGRKGSEAPGGGTMPPFDPGADQGDDEKDKEPTT